MRLKVITWVYKLQIELELVIIFDLSNNECGLYTEQPRLRDATRFLRCPAKTVQRWYRQILIFQLHLTATPASHYLPPK